jgi:hypothetical protein
MSRTTTATVPARLGSTPDDYSRIGIEPRAIKPWGDGMRTLTSGGTSTRTWTMARRSS